MIESYNSGSRTIDQILDDLVSFAGSLSKEQERHMREHLTDAELAVFDMLTRPGPELSAAEREEVKVEETLDSGLPSAYSTELYQRKCSAVFEHIYERYGAEEGLRS